MVRSLNTFGICGAAGATSLLNRRSEADEKTRLHPAAHKRVDTAQQRWQRGQQCWRCPGWRRWRCACDQDFRRARSNSTNQGLDKWCRPTWGRDCGRTRRRARGHNLATRTMQICDLTSKSSMLRVGCTQGRRFPFSRDAIGHTCCQTSGRLAPMHVVQELQQQAGHHCSLYFLVCT